MGPKSMDCIQLLKDMVSIPSPSGEEGPLARFLIRWAQGHGFERAYIDDAGNAVAEIGPPDSAKTFVLLGHMDTVPGDIPVRVDGDLLYGRGTVDAKGPLAAFFCAVARLGPIEGIRFVVVGATEEEAASSKGARYIRDRFLEEGVPQGCVIGEPSQWDRITLGYKGRLIANFRASEPNRHTADPRAIGVGDRGCQWWQGVKRLCQTFNAPYERAFDKLLPHLQDFRTHGDGLVNHVRVRVGLRLPPQVERSWLERELGELAHLARGEVSFSGYEPAYRSDKRNRLVRAFTRAIRAEGGRPGFKVKTGTSDMNIVGPAWKCPILAYGPGDSSLDHTPDEHISLSEYTRAIQILTRALRTLGEGE